LTDNPKSKTCSECNKEIEEGKACISQPSGLPYCANCAIMLEDDGYK